MAKHRGRNEGSIVKEPSGKYRAMITLPGGRRQSKTFTTKQECKSWLHEMNNQVKMGLTYDKAKIKLETYAKTWLEAIHEKRAEKTYLQYQSILDQYILPEFGRMHLRDIEPIQIENYLVDQRKTGLGNRSVQLIYVILHAILKKAAVQRLVPFNPLDAVEKPTYKPRKKARLTLEQRQQFLIAALGDPHFALYVIALTKGLREGELLGLMWDDLNWNAGILHVQRQVQRLPGKGMVFAEPKTDTGIRPIAMGEQVLEVLREHRQYQIEAKASVGKRWKENDLIFPGPVGAPMDPRKLWGDFKALLARIGLPKNITIHDLRHAALTTITNDLKAPIKVSQELAGHTLASTTLNIYADPIELDLHRTVAKAAEQLLIPVAIPNRVARELHVKST